MLNFARNMGLILVCSLLVACGENVRKEVPATPVASTMLGNWSNCKYFEKIPAARVVRSVNLDEILLVGGRGQTLDVPSGQTGVLVFLGMKPSVGFSVQLGPEGALRRGNELILNVAEQGPRPGRNVAQMLTYPCALLAVQGTGYQKVTLNGPLKGLPRTFAAQ